MVNIYRPSPIASNVNKKLLFGIIGLLWSLLTVAQSQDFIFKTFTTKDGLSYNLVNCLWQDREGYIWIGTFNGLNRYDGSRFVVFKYDRNNPHSLAHNNVSAICEDKTGDIWLGTPNGVSRYNKARNLFVNYLLATESGDASRENDVSNIVCDHEGTIWVTTLGGLYEFIPGSDHFKRYRFDPADSTTLSSNRVHRNAMALDPKNQLLWIGTVSGINCFDIKKKVAFNYRHNPQQLPLFDNHNIYPLTFDKLGRLVYGDYNRNQIVYYSPDTKSLAATDAVVKNNPRNSSAPLSQLFFDRNNNAWASSSHYFVSYKEANQETWREVTHDAASPSSIGSDFFWAALQTRDGAVYIGGLYGLSVYNPAHTFRSVYKPVQQLPALKKSPNFNSLAANEQGVLWLGNIGKGLVRYDFTTNRYEHFMVPARGKTEVAVNTIIHIARIENELWLSTNEGIHIFNPVTRRFRQFNPAGPQERLDEAYIHWTYMDRHKQIWFSAWSKFLYRYDPATRRCVRYNPDSVHIDPSKGSYVKAISEDMQGNVWMGTYSGRLYKYNRAKDHFESFIPDRNKKPLVLQRPINDLYADERGKVWMATEGGGLIRFDPADNSFKSWREADGLIMDVCKTVLPDKQGKIWIGSYEGYTIFDPLNESIENPHIDYGQGENNFFSGGRCLLNDGRLVFCSVGSFIVIDPLQINTRRYKPVPVISGITVFEKLTPLYRNNSSVNLTYKENFFTIDFSTLSLHQDAAIEYAYRLVNYDKDWVTGGRNFAAYTGVSGGDYQFEVKVRYKGEQWSEAIILPIYIKPPFWETWWFRIVMGLLVIASIIVIVKLREKRLVKEQKVKSEFRERLTSSEMKALRSQMNPHFLYNSLNAIRLFVLQNDSDNAEKYLVKFARLMRLILDNSRQDWINLGSEVEQLQLYLELEQLRFDNKFDFAVQVDPSLHKENTSVPPMIIQPYIENSILHGIAHKIDKGLITVTIQPSNGHLECIVEDNGVGRDKAQELKSKKLTTHKSVGLQVTKERLQLISERTGKAAGVEVVDLYNDAQEAVGTKVVICLPLVSQ